MRFLTTLAVAPIWVATAALAQEPPSGLYAGGFLGLGSDPYVGDNDNVTGVPIIGFRGDGYSIGTDGASATFFERQSIRSEAFLAPRFFALIDPDAPELAGIDREITVDAGLRFEIDLAERTTMDVSVAQEITGEHNGREIDLRFTQNFGQPSGLPFSVFAGATWQSRGLADYLYGVSPAEAIAGRPAYSPGATTTPYVGVNTVIPLSQRTSVFGSARAEFFGSEIENSPIIADDVVFSLGVGLQFSF